MRNLFNTTGALLLASAAAFAQEKVTGRNCFDGPRGCIQPGHEMTKQQMHCAYSAPARIEVRGSWDIYATGTYLYWQARQENLDLGFNSNHTLIASISTVSKVKHPNFTYRSGFKFGLGYDSSYDNWDAFAEYTWFHSSIKTDMVPGGTNVVFPVQGHPIADPSDIVNDIAYFGSASQYWNLKIDIADLSLARAYYSGTKLTIRPYFGARGAWIRQIANSNYYDGITTGDGIALGTVLVKNRSVSQGIGPRLGMDSNWLVGYGFRLIGNASGDILYTRYDVRNSQVTEGVTTTIKDKQDFLRSHTALDMGFGWGSYFSNNNWHVDLSATYGFQVFWNQNMFRFFSEAYNFAGSFAPNGNLYIHGAALNAKLDF
jgi:hypothetical protein